MTAYDRYKTSLAATLTVAIALGLGSSATHADETSVSPEASTLASRDLLSFADAMHLAQAALDACIGLGQPASVVVMDAAGFQRVALTSDGALFIGITTAALKAKTVVELRESTELLQKRAAEDPQFADRYSRERGYRLSPGGLPLFRGAQFVGAIAVAGARDHEKECAALAVRAVRWGQDESFHLTDVRSRVCDVIADRSP